MIKTQQVVRYINCAVYLCVIVWVVLFHATLETLNSAFDPDLRSINFYLYFNGKESLLNIMIFIPLGLYLEVLFGKKAILKKAGIVVSISLLFEIIQYVCAIGATDIMDIINNSVGGFAGLSMCFFAKKILKDHFNKVATLASSICTILLIAVVMFVPLR